MTPESYVDDEYDAKLDAFVAERPEVTRTAAEEAFVAHCEAFDEVTNDGTPRRVVRRLAFTQLEWDPPSDQGTADPAAEPASKPASEPAVDADCSVGESDEGGTRHC